jgi:hypothetical protein
LFCIDPWIVTKSPEGLRTSAYILHLCDRYNPVRPKSKIMTQVAALQRQRIELALSRHGLPPARTSPRKKRYGTNIYVPVLRILDPDPDPFIIKQTCEKNLDLYCFVTSF